MYVNTAIIQRVSRYYLNGSVMRDIAQYEHPGTYKVIDQAWNFYKTCSILNELNDISASYDFLVNLYNDHT